MGSVKLVERVAKPHELIVDLQHRTHIDATAVGESRVLCYTE